MNEECDKNKDFKSNNMEETQIIRDARPKKLKIGDNIVYATARNGITNSFDGKTVNFTGHNRVTVEIKRRYKALYTDNVVIESSRYEKPKVSIKANCCFKL